MTKKSEFEEAVKGSKRFVNMVTSAKGHISDEKKKLYDFNTEAKEKILTLIEEAWESGSRTSYIHFPDRAEYENKVDKILTKLLDSGKDDLLVNFLSKETHSRKSSPEKSKGEEDVYLPRTKQWVKMKHVDEMIKLWNKANPEDGLIIIPTKKSRNKIHFGVEDFHNEGCFDPICGTEKGATTMTKGSRKGVTCKRCLKELNGGKK